MFILDCTLRDGGYYTNWDFSNELVDDYLKSCSAAGINFIELGLRQFGSKSYKGEFAFTTPENIKELNLPGNIKYGVMVDAKTILSADFSTDEAVEKLFPGIEENLSLVRIACHFHEINLTKNIAKLLKEKRYIVGLNMMQISMKKESEILEAVEEINSWGTVDVLYFADSLGSMTGEDVENVIEIIKSSWQGDIGFHAHNNQGNAVSNCIKAISCGAEWIDATITGMGRGAGNAETEVLLDQSYFRDMEYDNSHTMSLACKHFTEQKRNMKWGYSVPYYLAAKSSIHPTYIQNFYEKGMLEDKIIEKIDILKTIENPNKYQEEVFSEVLENNAKEFELTDGVKSKHNFKSKKALIIANTNQTEKYIAAIKRYVLKTNSIVISLNHPSKQLSKIVDYVALIRHKNFEDERDKITTDFNYIAPTGYISEISDSAVNYGIKIDPNHFEVNESYCVLPFNLTVGYAVAFCSAQKFESIKLVGFEGHISDPVRNKEMNLLLNLIFTSDINIQSLTPTNYPIDEESIHSLIF